MNATTTITTTAASSLLYLLLRKYIFSFQNYCMHNTTNKEKNAEAKQQNNKKTKIKNKINLINFVLYALSAFINIILHTSFVCIP